MTQVLSIGSNLYTFIYHQVGHNQRRLCYNPRLLEKLIEKLKTIANDP